MRGGCLPLSRSTDPRHPLRQLTTREVEATGTIAGTVVFDVTMGRIIRREINPLTMVHKGSLGGVGIEQELTLTVVTHLDEGDD